MGGSGAAVRLHESRSSQDSEELDGPPASKPRSHLGRDVHGLYPGQLARVHTAPAQDCGTLCSRRSGLLSESPPGENYQRSFDLCTLRAVTPLRLLPAAPEQRPPQSTYREQFQSPLFPQ
ncbi:uncharacterized protein LOC144383077 isoform X2 [Gasterosteus aculeatus]